MIREWLHRTREDENMVRFRAMGIPPEDVRLLVDAVHQLNMTAEEAVLLLEAARRYALCLPGGTNEACLRLKKMAHEELYRSAEPNWPHGPPTFQRDGHTKE